VCLLRGTDLISKSNSGEFWHCSACTNPATGQVDQDISLVFLGPRANAHLVPKFYVALHISRAAFQTQNCTVSSYCCPPNTKPHRFVILLPSKHKTAPFRQTAAHQTQNRTVSSYCCPPNTKPHRFVILLPSKHKTAPFRHPAALQTQNRTVSSYCSPPNTKPHRFVILLPSKHKTHPPVANYFSLPRTTNSHYPSPYRLHFPTRYFVSSLSLPEGQAGIAREPSQ
jgi:hypothetical protein